MHESITLSTGRVCTLENPALPFLAHYHVLSFPADQGQPSREEAVHDVIYDTHRGGLRVSLRAKCRRRHPVSRARR
jgi:hypothetical protein